MDWSVNLYAPDEWDALELFEQDVLRDAPTIRTFRRLLEERIQRLSMNQIFGKILEDFETIMRSALALADLVKCLASVLCTP